MCMYIQMYIFLAYSPVCRCGAGGFRQSKLEDKRVANLSASRVRLQVGRWRCVRRRTRGGCKSGQSFSQGTDTVNRVQVVVVVFWYFPLNGSVVVLDRHLHWWIIIDYYWLLNSFKHYKDCNKYLLISPSCVDSLLTYIYICMLYIYNIYIYKFESSRLKWQVNCYRCEDASRLWWALIRSLATSQRAFDNNTYTPLSSNLITNQQ